MSLRVALLFLLASSLGCAAAEPFAGRWEGVIKLPGRELRVVIDLAPTEGGGGQGSIILPDLGIKGKPLADISVKGSEASFAIASPAGGGGLEAKFRGRLTPQGGFAGEFTQAGNRAPFLLEKTGEPQVDFPPRSTALAAEFAGTWKGDYEMMGYARHVTLKLASHGTEAGTAEFVIVGKRVNNIPVDLVTQEGESLGIDSNATGISYEGRLRKGTDEIKGILVQGPMEAPLILRRERE